MREVNICSLHAGWDRGALPLPAGTDMGAEGRLSLATDHGASVETAQDGGPSTPVLCGSSIRIAVQQRHRLFRDGLEQMLTERGGFAVVATAVTDKDLVQACHLLRPDAVLLDADSTQWDPLRLVRTLRRLCPRMTVVGLTAVPGSPAEVRRALAGGLAAVVSRDAGVGGILDALRRPTSSIGARRLGPVPSPARSGESGPAALTSREIEILGLLAGGLTCRAVSARLGISHKTVENHKQRIFTKLGVQNQAHAVSVALRTGLLRPERISEMGECRLAT